MALKQNRTRQTRKTKAAAAGPDNPFTGGGVANSPRKPPGPRSPGGHRKAESRVSRGPAPERKRMPRKARRAAVG